MKRIIYILIVLAMVSLTGCRKEIEFSGDEGKTYVVVMSQLAPDSVAMVNLAYSRFFLDNGSVQYINDAEMTLWVNGTAYQPSEVKDGNYTFPISPAAGDSVWFQAQVPGHGSISAGTRIVSYPAIDNVVSMPASGYEFWRMMDLTYLRFDLADPAGEKDYYGLQVIERDRCPAHDDEDAVDTTYFTSFVYMGARPVGDTTIPNLTSATMGTSVILTDSLIDGGQRTITLMAAPVVDTTGLTTHDYWLRITVYSPDMLQYHLSASKASSAYSMFAEPMQVYSNIQGDAVGIFASKVSRIVKATPIAQTKNTNRR